ncbi:RNA polymerase sigma factor [Nocardioides flavus (ex Wang et al. 2016)]|uniref:RNA polymerase sigma factor n=1 Tax=Nocardioides flavus (ex Wang et al. 2016) TaxID=2058780 RepID=A0ABQ3HLY3_9ACTN|nr:RNA polymerase sigma factor [Nocardioides flavus (ex Wang et al. 2016)]GHE17432.1 RNA polymerase sigma factor [Nocardioides flavus (ex Wang et al. 2016)]
MDTPHDVPAVGRDPDAFEAFYREHLPWVRRFVARRVDDPHTAADLTADIFLAVVDSATTYDAEAGSAASWLAGIARNVVADHVRRRVRESRANGRLSGRALLDDQSVERIADRIDGERMTRELYRSLAALPDNQRAVVELVAVDGFSLAEAAQVLGITAGNARVRYHRARARLQDVLPSPFEVIA